MTEVDGHDHAALLECFANVPLEKGKPSCIIANTIKGKGVSFAENKPAWHHGVPTREQLAAGCGRTWRGGDAVSTASTVPANDAAETRLYDCRDAYSQALEAMAEADARVCAVVSDSVSSTKLKILQPEVSGALCERGHCRAEHGRRGRGTGKRWNDSVRLRRFMLF